MQYRSINIYDSDTVETGGDTLPVSHSGGWYEVEALSASYPIRTISPAF
jgi:hypothetical protein